MLRFLSFFIITKNKMNKITAYDLTVFALLAGSFSLLCNVIDSIEFMRDLRKSRNYAEYSDNINKVNLLRSELQEIDTCIFDLKDKISDQEYLTLCNRLKNCYDNLK